MTRIKHCPPSPKQPLPHHVQLDVALRSTCNMSSSRGLVIRSLLMDTHGLFRGFRLAIMMADM